MPRGAAHHAPSAPFPHPLLARSTDALILLKVLTHHGVSQEEAAAKLPDLMAAMVEHYLSNAAQAGEGLELLPGVQALLEALAARRCASVRASLPRLDACPNPAAPSHPCPALPPPPPCCCLLFGCSDVAVGLVTGNLEPIGW